MSKVLYTQQIGRGTRKFPGKEALYVLDVVDNYGYKDGFSTIPWSIHALLGIQQYVAWGSLVQSQTVPMGNFEEQILVDLFEKERKVEEVDIFTFEEKYPDHISDEQIARELFVSTGTVRSWVKKGKLVPDVRIPFGRSMLNYYNPIRIDDIRKSLNLGKHNQSTIYEDFFNFLEERNYSLSYKLVMILSFLKIVDKHGTCNFDELKDEYKKFYTSRINAGIAVDKSSCPYSNQFLSNDSKLKVSILQNPFEKYND